MLIDEYLGHMGHKGYSLGTIDKTREIITAFMKYLGDDSLTELREDKAEGYIRHLLDKNISRQNISVMLSRLRVFYRYLLGEGYMLFNPFDDIEFKVKRRVIVKNIPSHGTIEELLSKPDTKTLGGIEERAIFELLYTCGIRLGETVRLDLRDINLAKRDVLIREGKGGKDRVVPIGKEPARRIGEYIRVTRRSYLKNSAEQALFITSRGKRITRSTIHDAINKYRESITNGRSLSPHRIRHACAIGMLRGGADIRAIQKLLGHNWLSTTQVYTQLSPQDLKHAHKKYHPRGRMKVD